MWKLILIFTLSLSTNVAFAKLTKVEKKSIFDSCLKIHNKQEQRQKICTCIVDNHDRTLEEKKIIDFMVRYYKSGTKLECGDYDMFCSGDFVIASTCSKDPSYNILSPTTEHPQHD